MSPRSFLIGQQTVSPEKATESELPNFRAINILKRDNEFRRYTD